MMVCVLLLTPKPDLFEPLSTNVNALLNFLSNSAGNPFFLVTTSLLCLIPIFKRFPIKRLASLYVQFALLLILSFALKTGLKSATEVPRPYSYALAEVGLVDNAASFYQLEPELKDQLIERIASKVSPARIEQWHGETNYAFPSGHTIFVAICILFWGGFLLRNNHYITAGILLTWGVGVGFSRIWLGMHWPTDLMASTVLASLLIFCVPTINFENNHQVSNTVN
ncbi:phosphatase PAP2 family protein [Aliivibrio fischeri]|uniref:phosphatase PAP2 family protein n=1 Tax=Aliivibrio fischeri TaxID=668 RepID=UPI0009C1359D|nr:phosphatase PAP2 family protein [Aliivibrio fischeri]